MGPTRVISSSWRPAVLAGLVAGLAAAPAAAQYFGGNKVRYENQDFHVLETEHFDIYTYPEEDARAADAAVFMERWNARLHTLLNHDLRGKQPLILYAGHPQFRQTNATPGTIGEGTGGFTEMFKRRIVLPMAGVPSETDHVLGHELVHAFQFDIARAIAETPEGKARGGGALALPLWFIEGMAEYLSIGSVDTHTAMWMRDAVMSEDLPDISDLNNPKYFPYRYGQAFWAYVAGRFGDDAVPRLLRTAARIGEPTRAIKQELRIDHKQLSKDWHEALKKAYGPAVAAGMAAKDMGRALVPATKGKGAINLAPVLSPDGKRMLFYSERELFSIELYLLDVESGEVIRRLTKAATDPHLDSLQFLASAGSWSPDGKRVVIGSIGGGRPELTIIDAETGDTVATHRFEDLVEIMHPAWSPDGKSIAFAGNFGGVLRLELFELESKARRTLTSGDYAAMQPAWSPDGKKLAFVTDRFTSDASKLTYGDYRLGLIDLGTGAVTPLPCFEVGKNINPQWSPDGTQIYFLADAKGSPNLFRLTLANGSVEQLSNLKTGITGITASSPALSVASKVDRIAVSVYERGMYSIHLVEEGTPRVVSLARDPNAPRPGALPPFERLDPRVDAVIADATIPKDAVKIQGPEEYKPSLGIDYVGQVSAGVGTNSAGSYFGGGISLYWSDMLGDHNLLTLLSLEGDSETVDRNLAAIVNYENRTHRWRWGVAGGQTSAVGVAYQTDFVDIGGGQFARRERLIRQWQINREIAGRTAYPVTRADRFEASAGYRNISYVTDAVEVFVDDSTGEVLGTDTVDLPSPPSIDLFPIGLAFVHDTSIFGGTAPVAGQRWRVELGGTAGQIQYWSPLIDFRQYFLPFPYLTLAGRVLHYGRYGGDADDERLGPVFVGSPTLVRGYTTGSFGVSECDPNAAPACPVFDKLFGTRIVVANAEVRVPVFGARGIVRTPSVPPIDIAAFFDSGVAWDDVNEAKFLGGGGDREFVRSFGYTLRVSFFGALVLQWNYVDPLDRPQQDWYWEFLISPGF